MVVALKVHVETSRGTVIAYEQSIQAAFSRDGDPSTFTKELP